MQTLVSPQIDVAPQGSPVDVGESVTLDCYSSRAESTRWYKEGNRVNVMTSDRFNLLTNGSLVIRNFTAPDNGDYFCNVQNPTGEATSSAVYVGVLRKYSHRLNMNRCASKCMFR